MKIILCLENNRCFDGSSGLKPWVKKKLLKSSSNILFIYTNLFTQSSFKNLQYIYSSLIYFDKYIIVII